jgi:hypothetical protein
MGDSSDVPIGVGDGHGAMGGTPFASEDSKSSVSGGKCPQMLEASLGLQFVASLFGVLSLVTPNWVTSRIDNDNYGLEEATVNDTLIMYAVDPVWYTSPIYQISQTTEYLCGGGVALTLLTFVTLGQHYQGNTDFMSGWKPRLEKYGSLLACALVEASVIYYTQSFPFHPRTEEFGSSLALAATSGVLSFIAWVFTTVWKNKWDVCTTKSQDFPAIAFLLFNLVIAMTAAFTEGWALYTTDTVWYGLYQINEGGYMYNLADYPNSPSKAVESASSAANAMLAMGCIYVVVAIFWAAIRTLSLESHLGDKWQDKTQQLQNFFTILAGLFFIFAVVVYCAMFPELAGYKFQYSYILVCLTGMGCFVFGVHSVVQSLPQGTLVVRKKEFVHLAVAYFIILFFLILALATRHWMKFECPMTISMGSSSSLSTSSSPTAFEPPPSTTNPFVNPAPPSGSPFNPNAASSAIEVAVTSVVVGINKANVNPGPEELVFMLPDIPGSIIASRQQQQLFLSAAIALAFSCIAVLVLCVAVWCNFLLAIEYEIALFSAQTITMMASLGASLAALSIMMCVSFYGGLAPKISATGCERTWGWSFILMSVLSFACIAVTSAGLYFVYGLEPLLALKNAERKTELGCLALLFTGACLLGISLPTHWWLQWDDYNHFGLVHANVFMGIYPFETYVETFGLDVHFATAMARAGCGMGLFFTLCAGVGAYLLFKDQDHLLNGYLAQFATAAALVGALSSLVGVGTYVQVFPNPLILAGIPFVLLNGYSVVFAGYGGSATLLAGLMLFYRLWTRHNEAYFRYKATLNEKEAAKVCFHNNNYSLLIQIVFSISIISYLFLQIDYLPSVQCV